jgi:hypothetical protein
MPHRLAALALVFATAAFSRQARPAALSGVWVAERYNGGPVPAVDRFPSTKGFSHYVKLEEGTVTLRPNGTFVSRWRYYHELLPDGKPVPRLQLKTDSYRGRYTLGGGTIVFRPDPSKRERNPRTITGTIAGERIRVTLPIDEAGIKRTLRMDLKRDPMRF